MTKIVLNGQPKEIETNTTVQDLLDLIGNKSRMIVVEKNEEIVPKDQYDKLALKDEDKIEVVSFVGGG